MKTFEDLQRLAATRGILAQNVRHLYGDQHGVGDTLLSAMGTIDYLETLLQALPAIEVVQTQTDEVPKDLTAERQISPSPTLPSEMEPASLPYTAVEVDKNSAIPNDTSSAPLPGMLEKNTPSEGAVNNGKSSNLKGTPPPGRGLFNARSLAECLITARELASKVVPPRLCLLGDWLCAGDFGILYAPRGVGKTWLGMAIPRAISQGISLGGWKAGEGKTRVLYIDGEMPLELTKSRSVGMQMDVGDMTYLHHEAVFETLGTSLNLGVEEHRVSLTELLIEGEYQCVVLDNLSCLASGVDENKGFDYEPIKNWLLDLRRRKITVIMILHAGRNGLPRGTSRREDDASWILSLTDSKQDDDEGAKFVSHFAKKSRNTGGAMADLLWHFTTAPDGSVSISCSPASDSDYDVFIRHVLSGMQVQSEIAKKMGKPPGTVSKWVKKALHEGRIRRVGGKLLPPDGESKLSEPEDE